MTNEEYYYARARQAMKDEQILFTPEDFGDYEETVEEIISTKIDTTKIDISGFYFNGPLSNTPAPHLYEDDE